MISAALSAFLVTLGLGQLISTCKGWRAASLVGPGRLAGMDLGSLLLLSGALTLPDTWGVLWWAIPAGPAAVAVLLLAVRL